MRSKGSQFQREKHVADKGAAHSFGDSLSDSPRGSVETARGPRSMTTYTFGPVGEAHAQLEVQNDPWESTTRYPPAAMMRQGDDFDVDQWYPATGQIPLFTHQSQPAKDRAVGLGAMKGARHAAMTMLGIAANDTARAGRGTLGSSYNLSEHSMGMMKHLAARGAVDQEQVPGAVGNSSTFWDGPKETAAAWTSNHGMETLSGDEVSRGRRTIRAILGRNRPIGEQTSLF